MRPIHVVTAALFCAAGALAACNVVLGLDDLKDQVDSGAADTGAGEGSVGDAGDGAANADAGPNCLDYCTSISIACSGSRKEYVDGKTCLAMCAAFPVGTSSENANTLWCRVANLSDCHSAGPYSAKCGGEAENFCALYMNLCPGDGGYGAADAGCPGSFGSILNPPDAGSYAMYPHTGNTRTCREFMLEAAYVQNAPCEAPSKDSQFCVN